MARKSSIPAIPKSVDLALLILRVGLALLMIPHGYNKLMSLLSGDMGFADPIGLGEAPSKFLTIFAELICSILVFLGLLTRPALLVLIFNMLVITFIVHANDGFQKQEHALLFLIPYISLFLLGPGKFSLDYKYLKKYL